MKRIAIVLALSVLTLMLLGASAFADTQQVQTFTITKPGGNYVSNPVSITLYPGTCPASDYARFFNNNTGGNIRIQNTVAPGARVFPNVTVPNNASSDLFDFCCDRDAGIWIFTIDNGTGSGSVITVTVNVKCGYRVPSLSGWGILLLIGMLCVTALWVARRNRSITAAR